MLKVTTEEQRQRIEEILAPYHTYISWPLDFAEETEAIYIDGNVTFDMLAEIVDYLRKK